MGGRTQGATRLRAVRDDVSGGGAGWTGVLLSGVPAGGHGGAAQGARQEAGRGVTAWPDCTDRQPCNGDTCDRCIARRLEAKRATEEADYTMRQRPQASPLFLLAAFTLRNPLIPWLARRGALSDRRVRYQLQANDFGDAESEERAIRWFGVRVEHDPLRQELR